MIGAVFLFLSKTISQSSRLAFVPDWTPRRSRVNLHFWRMWPTLAGVTYTYIEYSLYVPVLFLWQSGSHRDGPLQRHFSSGSQRTLALPYVGQQAAKRLGLLVHAQVNTLFWSEGPSKGQYAVTSQKLDSWWVAPRSGRGEEGHCAASDFLFVTFIRLSSVTISSRLGAPLISYSPSF